MVAKLIVSGRNVWRSASPTGGCDAIATKTVMRIMPTPSTITVMSTARPAFLNRKMPIASSPVRSPPSLGSMPSRALRPSPPPAMLPMLNASPPITMSTASTWPEYGTASFARSPARLPETVIMRQMFICTAKSMSTDSRMANANAAPSWAVKVAVWVMNPGPMAEVAMRKMAPRMGPLRLLANAFAFCVASGPASEVCCASDIAVPIFVGGLPARGRAAESTIIVGQIGTDC